MNFDSIVPQLNAIFATIAGLPANTQAEDQSFFFPQVGTGPITDANGAPVTTAANSQAKLTWDILGIEGVGWDEWRKVYDPNAVIADDTFTGPGAPLGGVVYNTGGQRAMRVQVKVECFDQSGGHSAHPILERVRTRLNLPTVLDALAAIDLGYREISKSTTLDYTEQDSGRRVSVALFEIVFNASDTDADDPITTIETVDVPTLANGNLTVNV